MTREAEERHAGETTGNPRVRVMAKQCSLGSAVKGQWMAVQVLGLDHGDTGALELARSEGEAEGMGWRGAMSRWQRPLGSG